MREIYVFVDSEGTVRYVGCSKDARRRCGQHWQYRLEKNTPCAAWLRTLVDRPQHVVVDVVDDEHADTAEQIWILFFREISRERLLNVTTGGSANFERFVPRPPPSAETRERIAASHRGRVVSEETRQKMREATSERWRSGFYQQILPEKRPKQSEAMKKAWAALSPDERKKRLDRLSQSRKGRKHSPETIQKMREAALARGERQRQERSG